MEVSLTFSERRKKIENKSIAREKVEEMVSKAEERVEDYNTCSEERKERSAVQAHKEK
ncbi:hypothetical protein KSP40_PGU005140 [Platanthera guangdongensis]|uniref:Uncharacterized protein n=1 Tax=Platanthera guangdongensis TaxID=2320717 RepID=A0ABR2N480_9ASPA